MFFVFLLDFSLHFFAVAFEKTGKCIEVLWRLGHLNGQLLRTFSELLKFVTKTTFLLKELESFYDVEQS